MGIGGVEWIGGVEGGVGWSEVEGIGVEEGIGGGSEATKAFAKKLNVGDDG